MCHYWAATAHRPESSSFKGSIDHDRLVAGAATAGLCSLHRSPFPTSEPNNKEIYGHPWSLLALFPWETTRSSCIDFQECPQKPGAPVGGKPLIHAALHMFL